MATIITDGPFPVVVVNDRIHVGQVSEYTFFATIGGAGYEVKVTDSIESAVASKVPDVNTDRTMICLAIRALLTTEGDE